MIVVDSSAILCLLYLEPEARAFADVIGASAAVVPVSCYLEAAISLRRREFPRARLEALLEQASLRLLQSDERQARLAVEADRRYGRGTGHPARLNFGDCLAYAAATAHDAPLLFKGDDFSHTDVKRAL